MIYPAISQLLNKVDNRYTLVMEVAKRARQITAGSESRIVSASHKPVTIAVQEVSEGKVTYERTKEGLK